MRKEKNMDAFLNFYEQILHFLAEITVHTLEIIGISIIIFGSVKVFVQFLRKFRNKECETQNVIITLGRSLALALEFKMGAEIVNTVIIRDLKELAVLAIIIALRAILAILIHWEIKNERRETSEKEESKHSETKEEEI